MGGEPQVKGAAALLGLAPEIPLYFTPPRGERYTVAHRDELALVCQAPPPSLSSA